jgi:hypothetical protein
MKNAPLTNQKWTLCATTVAAPATFSDIQAI